MYPIIPNEMVDANTYGLKSGATTQAEQPSLETQTSYCIHVCDCSVVKQFEHEIDTRDFQMILAEVSRIHSPLISTNTIKLNPTSQPSHPAN
jgi:SET domain-containing protein